MSGENRQFIVTWEIDVYAKNAKEAAEKALTTQRDPDSIATYFGVKDVKYNMSVIIELEEDECES
jgi:hypothetical protein